ncbi:cytochrome P450 [Immersiella caudata]|uniref:Bifunctional cytochrome P450/NADPH--P450 reductase n=1 Tax=Immersiella caudata TaxID=314043 RepID=A0AA39XEC5_9PEZI|nr:cytochrome P450 [Immersiella caudata]
MACPFHHGAGKTHPPPSHDDPFDANVPEGLPIPHPPEKLFTKNLTEMDPNFAVSSFWRLAEIYGPIFSLNLVKRKIIVISDYELINEVCDDNLYEKLVTGVQENIRPLTKNGLFTSYSDEEEWGIAHRTLVPVFGPMHVRKMFPEMTDILSQMVLRWDRFGPEYRISTMDDFTRLAFDVIGLCAFNYRFNAFYSEELIPFAKQLGQVLIETGLRTNRLPIKNELHFMDKKLMMENIAKMHKLCDDIVAERKAHPRPDVDDLLNTMLFAKDPVTGKGFADENIRYQMVTFLVAGHDTSAGTMMFLLYNLLQHPEALQKCYAEVDEVLGDKPLELQDIPKLKYIDAAMREALRYLGPIPAMTRHAKKTRLLGGKYRVTPDIAIVSNFKGLHHDPKVWGPDCNEFKPERWLNGGAEKQPPNAWKPFGTGVRSCIGRYLAEQEIVIAMAMIFQRFVVEQADPDYKLQIKSTLTIKPDHFDIKVRRRPGKDHLFNFTGAAALAAKNAKTNGTTPQGDLRPIEVFFGGNTGTCKSFGEDLETSAPQFGLAVPNNCRNLDEAVENLPRDRPVILITSSYEGLPPDNARNFIAWLETRAKDTASAELLRGVSYAVFGAGNKDWAATFHRIPKLVDSLMEKLGATRIIPAGYVDVSQDIAGPFEEWKTILFPALRSLAGVTSDVQGSEINVEITQPSTLSKLAGEEVSEGIVLSNCTIAHKGLGPEKKQIDILLPPNVEYRSGDYLAVQPYNPRESVNRVLRKFGLHPDSLITVSGTTKEHLKAHNGGPISAYELITTRVELATPASQRQVATLASLSSGPDAERLAAQATNDLYSREILSKRFSVLDLLEDFPSCSLPLASYLDMLTPLTPRQYSISSSPYAQPPVPFSLSPFSLSPSASTTSEEPAEEPISLTASLTYDIYTSPSLSHPTTQTFNGVASSYLSHLAPSTRLRCFVRKTNIPFHLPADPKTPVIMVAAGTGIAPMRAFIQDRVAIAEARPGGAESHLGPAILYYGCRSSEEDFLYKEELAKWEKMGAVKVRTAFSKQPGEDGRTGHVDERIWEDREELKGLFAKGARILVCGSAARLGRSTSEVCLRIWSESHPEKARREAEEWLLAQKEDRYVSDVFG